MTRVILGGLGGAMPVVLHFLKVDLVTTLAGVTFIVAVAFLIRVLLLIACGAASGYFHDSVTSKWQIFQLGMVAPAMFTGLLDQQAVADDAPSHHPQPAVSAAPSAFGPTGLADLATPVFVVAYASDQAAQRIVRPEETVFQQIKRGLFGTRNDAADWLVEVSSTPTPKEAQDTIAWYQRTFPMLKFTLFAPSPRDGVHGWTITVNGQMTAAQAVTTKAQLSESVPLLVAKLHHLDDVVPAPACPAGCGK